MTLIQLQYFQTLSYVLHYTKASELLHISQPSLSYSIGELEKELGVPLFDKAGKKIVLTKYGEQFLPYAEQAMKLLKEGQEQLRQMNDSEPFTVNLGYFYSISATLVPALLERFYSETSGQTGKIRFHFTQDLSYNIAKALLSGQLDLAFTLHLDKEYHSVPIMTQPLFLVVPDTHPLAAKSRVSLSDFQSEPQVMLDKDSSLRKLVENIFNKQGVVPRLAFEVKECSAAMQFVALHLGVAILPRVPSIEAMPVKMIPIEEEEFVRTIYFSWPAARKLSEPAKKVRDFIVDSYGGR